MCMLWCPRKSGGSKFDPCEYCGSLPTVSLSFDSSLLNSDLKAKLKKNINSEPKKFENDEEAIASLAIIFLVDGVTAMADTVIDKFLMNHPDNPRFLLLRSISALKVGVLERRN